MGSQRKRNEDWITSRFVYCSWHRGKETDRMGLHKSESQIMGLKAETRKPVLTIGLKIKSLCESKM